MTIFSALCILRMSLSCVGLVMLFCGIELLCLFCKVILSNTFRHKYKFFYGKSCRYQCSLTVSLQMSRGTRGAEQRANMNPPPPPPLPNPAELMQMMVEIRGCSLRPSTGWQIREAVMHRKGQLLTSIVASRTSWIRSPHLSEKLKNPFKLKSG